MTENDRCQTLRVSRRGVMQMMAGAVAAAPVGKWGMALAQNAAANVPAPVGKFISIDGNRVYVEDRGRGIPIVMAAGGQNRVETLRPLAEKLSAKYRVITWDRANLGRADLVLSGARDVDVWSDQLAGLIDNLKIGPAYVIGASSGGRVTYTTALRYPDHTRGIFTYLTTGGGTIGESLAKQYYFDYADLADKDGMAAVAKTPFWSERIALNPANGEKLMAIDPKEFSRVMRRWGKAMRSSDVVIGITSDECRQIKANGTPVGITQGCAEAPQHRRDRSEQYAQLTGATLIPTPLGYCEEANTAASYEKLITHAEVPESKPFRAYEMLAAIPGVIDEFIQKTEARYKELGLGADAFSFVPQNAPKNVGPAYRQ
ncbi:MAG: alpha/beta hydrolase [Bryobacteraceae bacterium]